MIDLFDNPEAIERLLGELDDSREESELAEAELGMPGGAWVLGSWPVCICGGVADQYGHTPECEMNP